MAEKKFQKQKLNKEDHKKVDDTAKNVRKVIEVGLVAIVSEVTKVIKKRTKA